MPLNCLNKTLAELNTIKQSRDDLLFFWMCELLSFDSYGDDFWTGSRS